VAVTPSPSRQVGGIASLMPPAAASCRRRCRDVAACVVHANAQTPPEFFTRQTAQQQRLARKHQPSCLRRPAVTACRL